MFSKKGEFMKHDAIKPINDYIIVKQAPADEKTKGGLYIPEIAKEVPLYGQVVATGPGKKDKRGILQPTQVKVGDHVYFTKNFTVEIKHNGLEHLMMKEDRVLLIEN
jgi:chaperonin GroES